jgi:hypothetical protein
MNEVGIFEATDYLVANYPSVIAPNGLLKKYIPPRENLEKIHEFNKGRPLYENPSKNICMLGPRDFGKSYLNS